MKQIYIITLSFILSSVLTLNSQSIITDDSPFIAGLVGGAQVSSSSSGNGGESPVAFAFGGSFGFPIFKNLYLYTRGSYSSKSNFQSYYNTSFLTGNYQISGEFTKVNSSFDQLLLNGGLLYNIRVSDEFMIGLNGGLTFSILNQEAKLRDGFVISSIDNEMIWGAFGGLILEKGWDESDFTTFFEAQYNYAESDAFYRSDALNAMNYTFGVRYYLDNR